MSRRKPSITPALCMSLIAHGLGVSAFAWWVVASTPPPKLAALDKVQILFDAMPKTLLPLPSETPPPPKPKPQAAPKKKPPEPMKFEKPQDEHDDSGEANGKGSANRSTDGKQPMQANAGRVEQADLMKDADQFADEAFLPASKGALIPNDAPPQKTPVQGSNTPAVVAQATPSDSKQVTTPSLVKPDAGVGPQPVAPSPATPTAAGTKEAQPRSQTAVAATPKPVEKEIRGHRATVSDTESVAFAKSENLTFHAGKLEGREGLKVKTTTPRLGDASYFDLQAIGRLHLVLGVTVDADGYPQDVQILESSGSQNVDQDFKNEVYNHWNLEPKKDKDGHPIDMNWVITVE